MKNYLLTEEQTFVSKQELQEIYNNEIDKTEYQDFEVWYLDMIKSGLVELRKL